ncbi:MAG: pilus assembly PilX N-terminal domain-containing protein [Deltaproteobacteria bacterium]|jgi:hypothetical protein|nr:pilus assembly PilX N-terminal domain-containing protein [Deltaproteobacteria bacterium]
MLNINCPDNRPKTQPEKGQGHGREPFGEGGGCQKKSFREGMILAFTLIMMIVMSLLASVIMLSTTTELSISAHNRVGREAFNAADSSAKIATLMGRLLLHPELGHPSLIISSDTAPTFPLEVEINEDRFNLAHLQSESLDFDYAERYREAANYDPATSPRPHLLFTVNDKLVATAVVNLDSSEVISSGFSLGMGDLYDTAGGPTGQVNLVVTVNGSSVATADGEVDSEPHAIITAIYRESF